MAGGCRSTFAGRRPGGGADGFQPAEPLGEVPGAVDEGGDVGRGVGVVPQQRPGVVRGGFDQGSPGGARPVGGAEGGGDAVHAAVLEYEVSRGTGALDGALVD